MTSRRVASAPTAAAVDDAEAASSSGELLSRWRRDLATWPGPALLVNRDHAVIAANDSARTVGVTLQMAMAEALAVLTEHLEAHKRRAAGLPLRVVPVHADDFDGWFIDAATVLPPDADAERTISQRLAAANLRLQEEIRRRRFLERQVLSVAEQEKRRISLELHDGLGQHLTGVAFVARGLADQVREGKNIVAHEVDWLVRLINEGVSRTRGLARGLWPVSLERGSLADAIRRLADDLESIFGVSCQVHVSDEPRIASNIAAHHVFRVAQEAANNAIKHGKARRLEFRLESMGEDFAVTVLNDGLAVDPDALGDGKGLGVVVMKLRADALGGVLSIEPLPAGGAEVVLRLPGIAGGRPGMSND
jgi:signal transduction histidine kinase